MVEAEPELKALMLRGLAGDAGAHHALLHRVSVHLRAFFRARMRDTPDDVEDLVQETLIALHTKRDTFDPAFPVTAWIYAIARHRLIDHWRRNKRRGISVPVEDAEHLLFAESESDATDAKRDVGVLLSQLPAKQRTAIQLIKLDGVSVRDAAARTGFSESDLKVSAHRGLKTLARLMTGEVA